MKLSRLRFSIALLCATVSVACLAQEPDSGSSVAGNERVKEIIETFGGRGVMADDSQPTPPQESLKRFTLRDGFDIDLVAHEPEVSQPLFLSWDSRGRMWVVQSRPNQYPAGLKVVRFDQYLRAVFDKVPEPPPHGDAGADKITVLEDTNDDGIYDKHRDVITGLNIATAVQVGRGGIWVLNPPYLLFYPDADGDDVPDRDPEVHLSGFGLQDTHSVANSLLWGPDGWLYGANGSTTGGTVSSQVTKGVRFEGQCIWRYDPRSKEFEIFAEGGGNTFSLDIDSKGRVFSGTNGGSTRGYYYPQGSYSEKNWGKHGPLTNPYAFGFFSAMKLEGDDRRFAQAFLIYEGGLLPAQYNNTIFAPNSLHNLVWNSVLHRDGSTYRTVDQENLLTSSDRWFRPVYNGVGPDGAIYLADWYDTRLSHVSPIDDWHKESGRIYRVRPQGTNPRYQGGDLGRLPAESLLERLDDPNKWIRQRAALELGWRGEKSVLSRLIAKVDAEGSLEALWAINLLDELSTDLAVRWLGHSDPHIRRWAVRLLGDRHEGHDELARLAAREPDAQVRSQLASTAKRIRAEHGLAVVSQLAAHSEDTRDPHLPLLNWWALEAHADQWPAVVTMLKDQSLWQQPLFREHLLGRLIQRYASRAAEGDLERCEQLVELAPDESSREVLAAGVYQAFQGRSIPPLPPALDAAMASYQASRGDAGVVLALRSGRQGAVAEAIKTIRDQSADPGVRIELVRTLSELRHPEAVDTLLRLATSGAAEEPGLRRIAIVALASYDDSRIPEQLIRAFQSSISAEHNLRATACRTLASRQAWVPALLNEIVEWRLASSEVPADVVQQLRTYDDPKIVGLVEKAFGPPVAISAPEKLAELKRLAERLRSGSGDPTAGKRHFVERCGNCHKLFGEGASVGPPLDGYDRANVTFWLAATLDPSLEIREGYQSYMAVTDDGRLVTGMIASQTPNTVTLRTAENREIVLVRDELEVLKALPTSLMPEGILKTMNDEQLQDLFAYLSLGTRR
ncbi:MAG: DUF7133 domain-containing protein [Planctomycetaceae bacterium]